VKGEKGKSSAFLGLGEHFLEEQSIVDLLSASKSFKDRELLNCFSELCPILFLIQPVLTEKAEGTYLLL
jgi:hypothetical protein